MRITLGRRRKSALAIAALLVCIYAAMVTRVCGGR